MMRGHEFMFVIAADKEYGAALRRRIDAEIIGVGPIEASIGTTLALQRRILAGKRPTTVVSLGSAGSNRCEIGSVWQISSVCWADMDASPLGFAKGITPFANHHAWLDLLTPLVKYPTATLSTSAAMLGSEGIKSVDADLADMETFAVVRASHRWSIPVVGIRAVSDNPGQLKNTDSWSNVLDELSERLAAAVDDLRSTRGG